LVQGSLTELLGDADGAIDAYQQALRHNQWSIAAMNAISHILRAREKFPEAMEYLRSILKLDPNNGDVWGSLGEHEPENRKSNKADPDRALLLDDGQSTGSLHGLPAGTVLSARPKGESRSLP
jgi:tetratricopeptide (TPR) repeat protein